jgi:hypothetical protein
MHRHLHKTWTWWLPCSPCGIASGMLRAVIVGAVVKPTRSTSCSLSKAGFQVETAYEVAGEWARMVGEVEVCRHVPDVVA